MEKDKIICNLRKEVKPALGCTELSVFAFGAAKAYETIGGQLEGIQIVADPATYRNSTGANIPGTRVSGPKIAALLGVLQGSPDQELEILQNLSNKEISQAEQKLKDVVIELKQEATQLFVDITVKSSSGEARVLIKNKHTEVQSIEVDGKVKYSKPDDPGKPSWRISSKRISELFEFVERVSFAKIRFALEALQLNKQLSQADFQTKSYLNKGLEGVNSGKGGSLSSWAEHLTAHATGARLTGAPKPAMSVYGSGSHGITATMPIAAAAEIGNSKEERCARATILSLLITVYIKQLTGRLTPFCGAVLAAGTGASAGIAYTKGGKLKEIQNSITNMISDIPGIVCDGANIGCALKAATAARSAVRAADLALSGFSVPAGTGPVEETVEGTIRQIVDLITQKH